MTSYHEGVCCGPLGSGSSALQHAPHCQPRGFHLGVVELQERALNENTKKKRHPQKTRTFYVLLHPTFSLHVFEQINHTDRHARAHADVSFVQQTWSRDVQPSAIAQNGGKRAIARRVIWVIRRRIVIKTCSAAMNAMASPSRTNA